jgi:hypothetical protein
MVLRGTDGVSHGHRDAVADTGTTARCTEKKTTPPGVVASTEE